MFIIHTPRQTRHKRFVSARMATPTRHTPKRHGRATDERERHVGDCGTMRGRYSADGAASLAPLGRGLERLSRGTFYGGVVGYRG